MLKQDSLEQKQSCEDCRIDCRICRLTVGHGIGRAVIEAIRPVRATASIFVNCILSSSMYFSNVANVPSLTVFDSDSRYKSNVDVNECVKFSNLRRSDIRRMVMCMNERQSERLPF